MLTCETCQAQLLHHLYGLLDDHDRLAVEGHLAGCAVCRAAHEAARRQQALLGTAAKAQFPGVKFSPSFASAPTLRAPAPRRAMKWAPYAVAACIALLLSGAGMF